MPGDSSEIDEDRRRHSTPASEDPEEKKKNRDVPLEDQPGKPAMLGLHRSREEQDKHHRAPHEQKGDFIESSRFFGSCSKERWGRDVPAHGVTESPYRAISRMVQPQLRLSAPPIARSAEVGRIRTPPRDSLPLEAPGKAHGSPADQNPEQEGRGILLEIRIHFFLNRLPGSSLWRR